MKSLLFSLLTASTLWLSAQVPVVLKINHKLGNNAFALNTPATNNLGNTLEVDRLEYYISGITLIHDGGQEIALPDVYILYKTATVTNDPLGTHPITNLEGIRFAIGVDPARNNLDPAIWPTGHPLAPKSPSMHWGWSAGYRFVAMEGNGGPNMAYGYEFHSLGNANYFTQQHAVAGQIINGELVIELNADYQRALENIDVSSGVIQHGSTGLAVDMLNNFAWFVFTNTSGAGPLSVEAVPAVRFEPFPNPIAGGAYLKVYEEETRGTVDFINTLGQAVTLPFSNGRVEMPNLPVGSYIAVVHPEGEKAFQTRVMVAK